MKAVVRTNGAAEDDTAEDDTVEDDTVEDGTADAVLAPRETGTAITAESCRYSNKRIDAFGLQASTLEVFPLPP